MSRSPSPLSSPESSPKSPARSFPPSPRVSPSISATFRAPRTRVRPRLTPRTSLERIAEEISASAEPSADVGENLSCTSPRIRRIPSHSSLLSSPALARVKKEWEHASPNGGTEPKRRTFTKPSGWNGKKGIRVGQAMKENCGICFESAVKPNKTRCCGQLFCFQHLSDWLCGHGSDGRCPTCRVPCSIEADTIYLHSPASPSAPTKTPPTSSRRAKCWPAALRSHRLPPLCIDTCISTPEASSSESGSSSDSESGESGTECGAVASYRAMTPISGGALLDSFGRILALLGVALVVCALMSE